ncbi:hypothetical protein ACP4DX_03730 [Parvimonas sp. G1604]|uniref:hypothetical protein n=1 Tax=Parvimonas sp. G1604 TaxID=3388845 RepID=UPI003CFBED96
MDNLYNYFIKFSDRIYFLTVKKLDINGKLYKNIDIPINSNVLLDNIKNKNFNEKINLEYFFEGILLLNGIDSNFSNITLLNNFIKSKNINLLEFVKSKIKFNNDNFDSIIYNLLIIRGLLNLEIDDEFIKKIYVKFLLSITDYDNTYQNVFLNEIKILLSDLSRNIENDSLINMLYGDLYVKEKFYIKANLYYKKNLLLILIIKLIILLIKKLKKLVIK